MDQKKSKKKVKLTKAEIQANMEMLRTKLHDLNLLKNKENLDLYFVPMTEEEKRKNPEEAKALTFFNQEPGKWYLKNRPESKPFFREFRTKKAAVKFLREDLKRDFLACVRYKRNFHSDLDEMPVHYYLNNIDKEFNNSVHRDDYRYEWRFIIDAQQSTTEYFEKYKDYILDDGTKEKEVAAAVVATPVKELPAKVEVPAEPQPMTQPVPMGQTRNEKIRDYAWTIYTLFAIGVLIYWIYFLAQKSYSTDSTNVIALTAVVIVLFVIMLAEYLLFLRKRRKEKEAAQAMQK